MLEFRFHGRGGQGVVILGKLAARLYFRAGKHVKEFPKFGVERRGAPVEGYVRVDDEPIHLACQIYHPDVAVVMSESILDTVDVTAGMAAGGLVIVNTGRPPSAFADRLAGYRVATIDASGIALGHGLGTALQPIANTTLFGAFARLMDVGTREDVEAALAAELKKPGANVAAALEAWEDATPAVLLPGEPRHPDPKPSPFPAFEDLPEFAYSQFDALGNRTGSWRSQRPQYRFKVAPCNARCPAGNDVRGFLEALAKGNANRALSILMDTSPFPATCGRVCPHPCEDECNRSEMDGAVAVRALERWAAAHGGTVDLPVAPPNGRSIGIVGAGPGGLSAAWQLARRGYDVTVYEAAPDPGGMLVQGIPAFRLPRDILRAEIARIVDAGVEIRCGVRVGVDVPPESLHRDHDAVLLALGLPLDRRSGLPGDDLDGVHYGLPLLRSHNVGDDVPVGKRVAIVGGGNTAIDVAGVSLRKSATRDVTVLYRRTRAEMPAIPEEVDFCLDEGLTLRELVAPVEVLGDAEGRVRALRCRRMELGEPDGSGRRRPVPIEGSEFEIECDTVVFALGQVPEGALIDGVAVDEDRIATDEPGLYVCGDLSTGEGTVAHAIGSGRRAALLIDEALTGDRVRKPESWAPLLDEVLRFDRIRPAAFAPRPAAAPPRLPVDQRLASEAEVVLEIADGCGEAGRCLSCGTCTGCDRCWTFCPEPAVRHDGKGYAIDMNYCKGCGICFEECPRGVIDLMEERV